MRHQLKYLERTLEKCTEEDKLEGIGGFPL